MIRPLFLVIPTLVALSALTAQAQSLLSFQSGQTLTGQSLTGNVTYEGWNNLTTARLGNASATGGPATGPNSTRPYGNHNNTAGWYIWAWDAAANGGVGAYVNTNVRSTIASNLGSGSSTLWKSSGYGYIASESLHQGFPSATIAAGGNFVVTGSAIEDLDTIVFQVQATDRNENVFSSMPTLTINGNTYSADYTQLFATIENYSTGGFGAQDMDFYAFQWDLSALTIAEGSTFTIDFTGLTNSGIFSMQLNQSDTFVQVVPEPTVGTLVGVGMISLLFRRRRSN